VTKADIWMPVFVGDYVADTLHLTTEQHGAYWLLILACWKAGGELPDDDGQLAAITRLQLAKWRTHAAILRPFFAVQGTKLIHRRVAAELAKARELSAKRSEAGKRGGRPRKAPEGESKAPSTSGANGKQPETNCFQVAEANDEQTETPSHSPSPPSSSKKESAASPPPARSRLPTTPQRPDDVDQQVWSDWCALRKAKRAPVTLTTIDSARAEAEKAGMSLEDFLRVWCARGSQGLQADWLKPHERRTATSNGRHASRKSAAPASR
jgi:uncharacterized protein YdaU (DUF1376 family)